MSERSAEEIRQEIAAERQRLVEDIADLRGEARSFVPVAIALFAVAVVVRSKTPGRAARLLWRLR